MRRLHDTSSQLRTQRDIWARKIARDRADHGAWDSFQNDAGGTFKGLFGFDFGIGRSESKTYQEEEAQWSSPVAQVAITFAPASAC